MKEEDGVKGQSEGGRGGDEEREVSWLRVTNQSVGLSVLNLSNWSEIVLQCGEIGRCLCALQEREN